MISLVDEKNRPSWVVYPTEYLEMIKNGNDEFLPWYLMDREQLLVRFKGMQKRYPTRSLFPFARDDQSDDVACWEKNKPGKIVLIHDFASPGYENKNEFESFEEWYNFVVTNYS